VRRSRTTVRAIRVSESRTRRSLAGAIARRAVRFRGKRSWGTVMHLPRDAAESGEGGAIGDVAAFVDALAEYVADLLLDGRLDAMSRALERDGFARTCEIAFTRLSPPSSK
jgi:hypothetical protein